MRRLITFLSKNKEFLSLQGPHLGSVFVSGTVYLGGAFVLADDDRGFLALVLDLSYLASAVALFGGSRAMVIQSRGPSFRQLSLAAIVAKPSFLLAAVTAIAGAAGWFFFDSDASKTALLIALLVLAHTLSVVAQLVATSSQPTRIPVTNYVNQVFLFLAFWLLIVTETSQILWWVAVYVAGSLAFFGILRAPLFQASKRRDGSISGEVRDLRRLGAQIFPAEFSAFFLARVDKLIVAVVLGLAELGVYVLYIVFFELMRVPLGFLLDTSIRGWRSLAGSELRILLGELVLKFVLIIVPFSLLLGLGALAFQLLLFGPVTNEKLLIITFLTVASVCAAFVRLLQAIFVAKGAAVQASIFSVLGAVLLTFAAVGLAPSLGVLGVVIAQLLAAAAAIPFHLGYFFRMTRKRAL